MRRAGRPLAVVLILLGVVLAGCAAPTPPGAYERKPTLYEALLLDDPYPHLRVEVHHVTDRQAEPLAVDTLEETLRDVVLKDRIDVWVNESALPAARTVYDLDALRGVLNDVRPDAPEDTVVLPVVYLNGRFETGGTVGLFALDAIFIFKDEIRSLPAACTDVTCTSRTAVPEPLPGGFDRVERAVLIHELGHALGLVNLGVPMQTDREDGEHPGHSTRQESVMYAQVHTAYGLLEYAEDNEHVPYRFDAHDLADLRAFQDAASG